MEIHILLNKLDKYDQNEFIKYLKSPFLNNSRQLQQFYNLLSKQAIPNDHTIWSILYPEKKFNPVRLRKLYSDLSKLLKQYFAHKIYMNDEWQIAWNKLVFFHTQKLNKNYAQLYQVEKNNIEGSKRDIKHFYKLYKLEELNNLFLSEQTDRKARQTNLPEILNNLDSFYLIAKLNYTCSLIAHSNVFEINYKPRFINEILTYLKTNKNYPFELEILFHIYQMLITENRSYYDIVITLLDKHFNNISINQLKDWYTYLINFCVRKINSGKIEFVNELFDLYKILLDREIIMDNGKLSPWHYKNITSIGLRLKQYKWINQFLENYKFFLSHEHKENAYVYNMARLNYEMQEYKTALELLNKVKWTDIFYALDSRMLLLKAYYELDEVDALYSHMESFSSFLKRNKNLTKDIKLVYHNFLSLVKKIISVQKTDDEKIKHIEEKISELKALADINWLKDKLNKIKNAL